MKVEQSERDPVDRLAEEFVTRYRRGERPSISEFTQRFPELADKLHEILTALVLIEEHGQAQGRESARSSDSLDADAVAPQRLGEYRILREVGRGGMGVVYEALQESLGRHVALKVLPSHALLDSLRLKRFQHEAQAAARLHHTNIVPVFGVGTEGGVHFYAMQFIAGRGLDEVIDEVRRLQQDSRSAASDGSHHGSASGDGDDTPAAANLSTLSDTPRYYRSAALLGAQVADALEHAHRQGILHRDIKPANLLLDARGTVWVTDFGLAKAEGLEELTQTGDLVGTLRYTPPERLHGDGDERSDVYSLGLTLYELLTLRPAFETSNRAELLRQIGHDEPPPPRQLDPKIPRDLETIVLKAIAKEPGRRYGTAGELADDLRRFLADRPIEARRMRWWERAGRWCRRNPAVALSSIVAAAALVTGLAVSLWQWQRANASLLQAQASARQSDEDFRLALASIDQMLTRAGVENWEAGIDNGPRRAMLMDAIQFYEKLLDQKRTTDARGPQLAAAHLRVGQVTAHLGDEDKAEHHYAQALVLIQDLLRRNPTDIDSRSLMASLKHARGRLQAVRSRPAEAEADYRDALQRWADVVDDDRTFLVFQAFTLRELSRLLRQSSRGSEAEPYLRQQLDLAKKLQARGDDPLNATILRADGVTDLADVCYSDQRLSEAEAAYGEAIVAWQAAAEQASLSPPRRSRQAAACHNLALLRKRENPAAARLLVEQAVTHQQAALMANPQLASGWTFLARHYALLNVLLIQLQEIKLAEHRVEGQLAFLETMAALHGEMPSIRRVQAQSYGRLGMMRADAGRNSEAEAAYRQAVAVWRQLTAGDPGNEEFASYLGAMLNDLACVLNRQRRWQEMIPLAEEAIGHQETAIKARPKEESYQRYCHNHYTVLARAYHQLGDHRKVAEAVKVLCERFPKFCDDYAEAVRLASCIPLAEHDGQLSAEDRERLAADYANLTVGLLRAAQKKNAKGLSRLAEQQEFRPLHGRADFQDLLAASRSRP